MKSGKANPSQKSDEGRTDEAVAKELGIGSRDTYRKEKAIVDNRNLISAEDFANWDEGKLSTNKVYQQIKAERVEYGRRLEQIEREKAKERMSDGGKGKETFPNLQTRDAVAEQLGIGSGKQYEKEKTIVDNRNLISAEDFANWDEGKLFRCAAFRWFWFARDTILVTLDKLTSQVTILVS